jgi:glucose-1-phosphate adenylyltransferase
VLVLSGDHVYRMDYRALLHEHERRRAALTLAVTRVPAEQSRRFGMTQVDRDGRVLSLVEKPERAETPYASMGIYLFDRTVLGDRLRPRPVDLVMDVVRPMLEAGDRVVAYEFEGYWEDVGTIRSYYHANLELVRSSPRFALYDAQWPILTRDEERPPVVTLEGARVESSLVANGCRIAGTVRNSVLSPGVRVERRAEVRDAVVMADTVIGEGATVDRAIVDKYVRVGAGAVVGFGAADPSSAGDWLDGLVLVGKDARIPEAVRVGRSTVVGVAAEPADFTDHEVAAGSILPNRSWFEDVE